MLGRREDFIARLRYGNAGVGGGDSVYYQALGQPINTLHISAFGLVRIPGKKSKKALRRSEEEVTTKVYPHLAIIDAELWARVKARFAQRKNSVKGRPPGVGKVPHALSGFLRCGVCGLRDASYGQDDDRDRDDEASVAR